MHENAAATYLGQPAHSFWKWEDRSQVAAWTNGGTLAFRAEIEAIVRALSGDGLPPLESILLLLAACHTAWDKLDRGLLAGLTRYHEAQMPAAGISWRLMQQVRGCSHATASLLDTMQQSDHPLVALLDAVLAGLDGINALPQDYRSTVEARTGLARLVFDRAMVRQSPYDSAGIVAAINGGLPAEMLESSPPADAPPPDALQSTRRFVDSLASLFQGLSALPEDPERLQMLLRTGMENSPAAADVQAPVGQTVQDLLAQLDNDEELSGVSRLARDLLAVVCLPRRSADHDELPVGGFSDITNRGPLDRLLPGELAHDDLTLSVRIALNEAMYFRREKPPCNPISRRRILIDTGIRMWGVPRVFGAAVALAMAATAQPHSSTTVYRTSGKGLAEVDVTSREGLTALMESLEIEANPSESLSMFLADDSFADESVDNILITDADVLADREFGQAAAALCDKPFYIASVDRTGDYMLERWSSLGHSVLRKAQLNLDCLLGNRRKPHAQPLIDPSYDPSLPVMLAVRPFPLLLPIHTPKKTALLGQDGTLIATYDRRLMLWQKKGQAALQLTDSLPSGAIHWLGRYNDRAIALIKCDAGLVIAEVDLDGISSNSRTLPMDLLPLAACLLDDRLCLIHPGKIDVFSIETAALLQTVQYGDGLTSPGSLGHVFKWQRGRIFQDGSGWQILGMGPKGVVLEPLKLGSMADDLLALFERDGLDGLWGVLKTGEVIQINGDTNTEPTMIAAAQFRSAAVSHDGNRLVLQPIFGEEQLHLDLNAGTSQKMSSPKLQRTAFDFGPAPSGGIRRNLQKIAGIGIDEHGRLCLALTKRGHLLITCERDSIILTQRTINSIRQVAEFRNVAAPKVVGYQLKMATSQDGSKAWVDSRGLLHLKSSDPLLAEVTLVLVGNGATAGWASDGTWYGQAHFVGDRETVDAQSFYQHIEEFTKRLV